MKAAFEGSYLTYDQYLQQPGYNDKNFNDYLIDYFREKAAPWINKALENSQTSYFSRITNDLPCIHPELTLSSVVSQFMTAVDYLGLNEEQYRVNVIKRWFYASTNMITQLFLDKDAKIKDKFLVTLIGKEFKSLEEVHQALYGNPQDLSKIAIISGQIVASAALAIVQLLATSPQIAKDELYRQHAYGMPEDGTRLKPMLESLTLDGLRKFVSEDYYLSRLKLFHIYNSALSDLNKQLPHPVENLTSDLILMYDRLVIHSPIAGTEDYNQVFNCYLSLLDRNEKELQKQIQHPYVKGLVSKMQDFFNSCFNDLRDDTCKRSERLEIFASDLKDILQGTEYLLQNETSVVFK